MGFISTFLQKPRKPKVVEDAELGRLTQNGARWELEGEVDAARLSISLPGTDEGPTPDARAALAAFRERYRAWMLGPIAEDLLDGLLDAKGRPVPPERIFEEYAPGHVSLRIEGGVVHVELGLRPKQQDDHYVRFHFENWQPVKPDAPRKKTTTPRQKKPSAPTKKKPTKKTSNQKKR